MLIRQRAENDTFGHTALEIVETSGPIGIESAMNALAVAVFVEAIMVLAKMLERQQREEGFRQGVKEGRKRSNAIWRAWAKEKGIPVEDLPIEDETDDDK